MSKKLENLKKEMKNRKNGRNKKFEKFKKKSLNMQLAVASSLLITQIPFWIMMLFNSQYEGAETKPYYILFIIFFMLFVFSRHGLNHYLSIYKTYKTRFTLLMS